MNRSILIADSGGTKTDWCYRNSLGEKKYFSTDSYHPRELTFKDVAQEKVFFKDYYDIEGLELHFFGAGCLKTEIANEVSNYFKQLGFKNVSVESDIVAAGLALNEGNGWGAICGTGSVVFQMENGTLKQLVGGTGRESGDEGSGYYFGKLVSQEIESRTINPSMFQELNDFNFDNEKLGELSSLLKNYKSTPEIEALHRKNIQSFANKYLKQCDVVSIAGSYAYFHQDFFREELSILGIEVLRFIHKPIMELADKLK